MKLSWFIIFVFTFIGFNISYGQVNSKQEALLDQKHFIIHKHASYTGLWLDMTGYIGGKNFSGAQISGRLGYGYFINKRLSPILSGIYFYAHQATDSQISQSHYVALMPAIRYYFTKYNRLFIESSYTWAYHYDLPVGGGEKNYNTQTLGIGMGFNIPLFRKGRYKWLNKNIAFEGLYNYFHPISREQSIYLKGSKFKLGLVLYF